MRSQQSYKIRKRSYLSKTCNSLKNCILILMLNFCPSGRNFSYKTRMLIPFLSYFSSWTKLHTHCSEAYFSFEMLHSFTVHKYIKFHFWLQEKYGLPWADIYKTWNCVITLWADILQQISPKFDNKCWKVQKESHLPQYVKHPISLHWFSWHSPSIYFCRHHLYRILPKWQKCRT